MEEDRVGLFVIPARHLSELKALRKAASDSLNANRDDSAVLGNKVHRRAVETCVYHAMLAGDESTALAPEMYTFVRTQLDLTRNQSVFAPDEVRIFAAALADLERRTGGEDAVIERIHHRALDQSIDAARALYQALKRVLAEAEQHRAGFLWSTLYASAEQQLAEEQEKRRRYERDLASRTPDESAAQVARIQAWVAGLEDAKWDAQWERERNQDPHASIRDRPLRYVLLRKAQAAPLRRQLVRAVKRYEASEDEDGYEGKMR